MDAQAQARARGAPSASTLPLMPPRDPAQLQSRLLIATLKDKSVKRREEFAKKTITDLMRTCKVLNYRHSFLINELRKIKRSASTLEQDLRVSIEGAPAASETQVTTPKRSARPGSKSPLRSSVGRSSLGSSVTHTRCKARLPSPEMSSGSPSPLQAELMGRIQEHLQSVINNLYDRLLGSRLTEMPPSQSMTLPTTPLEDSGRGVGPQTMPLESISTARSTNLLSAPPSSAQRRLSHSGEHPGNLSYSLNLDSLIPLSPSESESRAVRDLQEQISGLREKLKERDQTIERLQRKTQSPAPVPRASRPAALVSSDSDVGESSTSSIPLSPLNGPRRSEEGGLTLLARSPPLSAKASPQHMRALRREDPVFPERSGGSGELEWRLRVDQLSQEMVGLNEALSGLREERSRRESEERQRQEEARRQVEELEEQVQFRDDLLHQRDEQLVRTSALLEENRALQEDVETLRSLMQSKDQEIAMLRAQLQDQAQSALATKSEFDEFRRVHFESKSDFDRKLVEMQMEAEERFRSTLAEKDAQIELHYRRYLKEFQERRHLHNEMIEIKGNIRVYCRVRPILPFERKEGGGESHLEYLQDCQLVVNTRNGPLLYEFGKTFRPADAQETVFSEVEPFITSVLDGFNVCIFAYGQTGSGKTFTMEGPPGNPGVNYRAIERLFEMAEARHEELRVDFGISVAEIYNDGVYDLLATQKKPLEIHQKDGNVFVPDLITKKVPSFESVRFFLDKARDNRVTASHSLNDRSSRSHLLFTVYVRGSKPDTDEQLFLSRLNLIDLAGSERVTRTEAEGVQLQEANAINRSLSDLGTVINALGAKQSHIPYRNSKLTFLLQNSLNGSSKVIMFVNLSPALCNQSETLSSLNFAIRCRNTELKPFDHLRERKPQITKMPG